MEQIRYTVILDLTDNGCFNTGWRIKQGDSVNSVLWVKVTNNGETYFSAENLPEIVFKRADGYSVISTMEAGDDEFYTYSIVGNELAIAGPVLMDVKFSDEGRTSTASCKFDVVPDTISQESGGSDVYNNTVAELSKEALEKSRRSEAWAVGTIDGIPVPEGDENYHNNAKYWAEQSQGGGSVVVVTPTLTSGTKIADISVNGENKELFAPEGGATDYLELINKPQINGVELNGNKSSSDLGINVPTNLSELNDDSNHRLVTDAEKSKWNAGGGGGGLLPKLHIVSETGSIVTVTNGETTINPIEQSGVWECDVPSFGTWTINSDLNGDVSTVNIYVDTVKIYNIDDSHFHATITVTFPQGATCYVEKGAERYYATQSPYVFTVHSVGEWTVTATKDSQSKSKTVVIESEGQSETVDIQLVGFKSWLESGGITSDYSSLDDVTETDIRKLMTKHASADYLLEWYNADNSIVQTFTNNAKAMKWIGLRDYICDKLMAIDEWKSAMLESEYWEYILKDKVPISNENSMPYGEIGASSAYRSETNGLRAFNGTINGWIANEFANAWIFYGFTNPTIVKKVSFNPYASVASEQAYRRCATFKIQASNDSTNWIDLYNGVTTTENKEQYFEFDNDVPYLKYRLVIIDSAGYYAGLSRLQFYGRSLNVSSNGVGTLPPQTEPKITIGGVTYWTNKTEREFEEGSTIKYLYDNGLELEPLNYWTSVSDSGIYAKNENEELIIAKTSSAAGFAVVASNSKIDLTPYKIGRAIGGERYSVGSGTTYGVMQVGDTNNTTASLSYNIITTELLPNNIYIGVDSYNESKYPRITAGANGTNTYMITVKEWWLE